MKRFIQSATSALCLSLALASAPSHAQSEASVLISALPVASVVGVATSAAGGTVALSAVPAVLSVGGAVLVVKSVEVSARGSVWVLERASDGVAVSLEVAASAAQATSVGVGTAVSVAVIGTGVLLSAAGQAIAFIPNELGRALLYNERLTN